MEAIAACVPENKVDNLEFAKAHFEEDMESTLKALGVLERHVAVKEETTSMDMCVAAAEKIFAVGKEGCTGFGKVGDFCIIGAVDFSHAGGVAGDQVFVVERLIRHKHRYDDGCSNAQGDHGGDRDHQPRLNETVFL